MMNRKAQIAINEAALRANLIDELVAAQAHLRDSRRALEQASDLLTKAMALCQDDELLKVNAHKTSIPVVTVADIIGRIDSHLEELGYVQHEV